MVSLQVVEGDKSSILTRKFPGRFRLPVVGHSEAIGEIVHTLAGPLKPRTCPLTDKL